MEIADFDWDKFEAEGKELEQRMRAVVVELDRQQAASRASRPSGGHSLAREQPPPGNAWDGRLDRFERMLTETLNTVTGLQHDVSALQRDVSGLKGDVGGLKGDVAAIREQMATKVELEALRDSINIVADGFAQTQTRLGHVTGLLQRYLAS
ncbi:MAG TPA: hypothetical protein VMO26_20035 [Vicinamibacterales bacterium]|nr:hypothetical protein [Vicinamibacterales bacterium]